MQLIQQNIMRAVNNVVFHSPVEIPLDDLQCHAEIVKRGKHHSQLR